MRKAVLLLGHGSARPGGNADLPEIAERLAARLPGFRVAHAFLRHAEPELGDAVAGLVASGIREIVLHPYFLGRGGHVVSEIPELAARLRSRFPGTEITVTPPLGVHDGLVDAVMARVLEGTAGETEPSPSGGRGYVHVYTGRGKGKTTSAIGLAVRAAGAGLRVLFVQFLKSGSYSEVRSLRRFPDRITLRYFGTGHFIEGRPTEADRRAAREGFAEVRRAVASGAYDMLILDEANVAARYGLIGIDELLEIVRTKPGKLELVITGRNADDRLIELADLVTEMREVKHYYKAGVPARRGIEK